MHIDTHFKGVPIMCAKYYEYWTMFDETTASRIWRVFSDTHCATSTVAIRTWA